MALTKASYSMITGAPVNVMDYMTAAQIADVISGADTLDVSGAINAAITAAAAAQSANPVPGRAPGSVYFPAGSYRCTATINAASIGQLIGESRDSVKILCYATPAVTCHTSLSVTGIYFLKKTGGSTCLAYPSGAYLPQILWNAFTSFTIGIDFQGSFGITKTLIEGNSFDSNVTAIAAGGTCTTLGLKNNQFNTGTTCIRCANCFNFEITGNNFEDYTTPIVIDTQLTASLIAANWFEKAAAASVTPYTDNTNSPGFFTLNNFLSNRYASTATPIYGVNCIVADTSSVTTYTRASASDPNGGAAYAATTYDPLVTTAAASTAPANYTVRTQDAVGSFTSPGGDYVFRLGAGSNAARYGAPRPFVDNTSNLGDASFRWAVVYAATGTINTSDQNEKTQIETLSNAEKATALAIKANIKKFKFKDAVTAKGDKARIHVGVIAQEVAQAFVDNGLNPQNYAMFCSDTWHTIVDESGETKVVYPDEKGDYPQGAVQHTRMGIRYDELLAFIISSI
jgi:hypothetical protein